MGNKENVNTDNNSKNMENIFYIIISFFLAVLVFFIASMKYTYVVQEKNRQDFIIQLKESGMSFDEIQNYLELSQKQFNYQIKIETK